MLVSCFPIYDLMQDYLMFPGLTSPRIWQMFQIYDVIQLLYVPLINPTVPFHFTHGDLNATKWIADRESGELTGFIDWEMAGFQCHRCIAGLIEFWVRV